MGKNYPYDDDDAAWYGVTIAADFVDPVSKVVSQVTASGSLCCEPINYGAEIQLAINELTSEVFRNESERSKITRWLPPIIIKL